VALAIAGALVAYDKFAGCSTSWMGFIATEHQVWQLLQEFQVDWELERTSWQGGLASLVPGLHKLRLAGAVNGSEKHVETVVAVPSGGAVELGLTLD
jgi:hypothetical protein